MPSARRTRSRVISGAGRLERRDALARYLPDAQLTSVPRGGLNLWLSLPDGIDDVALAGEARQAGVVISPGRPFYAAEQPHSHVRLSFAATPRVAQLDDGVRRLASALHATSPTTRR